MTSVRRTSRKRADARNPIESAWDAGHEPPPEAADPDRRDDVLACVFFRWAERKPSWQGHHPHLRDWLRVLHSLA